MSYIGRVEQKASDIRRFNVTGSTSATHTLTWTAPNEQSLIITINGVKQQEDAYSVSGVTLTLTSPLVSTDKMEVVGILDIGEQTIPGDNSVTTVKIQDDAVTADKLASGLANATHTGDVTGATALTIANDAVDIAMLSATGTADATTFLRGDNAWATAGGDNTPSFYAYLSASQSISTGTWTKCNLNAEEWDTDSAFDSSTNYRFTVPSGKAGKYNFSYGTRVAGIDDNEQVAIALYKNGSALNQGTDYRYSPGASNGGWPRGSVNLNLSVADYIELWVYHDEGASQDATSEHTFLTAFKLIGV
jgi:hypothetical protein